MADSAQVVPVEEPAATATATATAITTTKTCNMDALNTTFWYRRKDEGQPLKTEVLQVRIRKICKEEMVAARCLLDSHLHSSSHLSPLDLLGHLLGTFQGLAIITMDRNIEDTLFFHCPNYQVPPEE
ncbi:hypothetical protein F2Q70_00005374 [Brassica cretica]|uniref:Uncharacterized protein n=1 Tax=Brassica cretica TaxID=69181 RepID=A0A8S9J134_BRACR|nr:hypothetical protein F2Q70_00005374 [Brassica cretica]